MEKQYKYAIRKTTLGVGSVAIAAILAGQVQAVQAAEGAADQPIELTQPAPADPVASEPDPAPALELAPEGTPDAVGAPADNSNTPDVNPEAVPTPVNAPAPTEEPTVAGPAPADTTENNSTPEYKNSTVLQDEKTITNGKGYRQSEIAGQGAKIQVTDENLGKEIEGVRVETLQPSATSDGKRAFGVEVNIDKTKSDRTYNGFYITDSVRGVPVDRNEGSFLNPGETLLTNTEDVVTYKPDSLGDEISTGRQIGFDYYSNDKDKKHIANKETGKVTLAWEGKYTEDNPNNKLLTGDNFEVSVGVNPYPNENKDLSLITIEGNTTISKVPIKNQYIVSDARVKNAGEEDYTRLIGEVYHPNEDILVNGAQALIVNASNLEDLKTATGNNNLSIGQIVFKMPQGALQGKSSIFNHDKFKGVQNLRAKFFARPRTAEEFTKLAKTLDEYGSFNYESTGAGTKVINHNGQDVTIDLQGIDRYDHYNLIGEMTINLDDTKYYDQSFKDGNGDDTAEHTSSKVLAGETFEINMYEPTGDKRKDNQKSAEEMNKAKEDRVANGEIKLDFVNAENKKIAEKLKTTVDKLEKHQKWDVDVKEGDISNFKITPPKSAKVGEFIAVPVEYTYTNGSRDIHWFHFVVQDSDNNKPEYKAEVGFQGETLTKTPELSTKEEDLKKNQPQSYKLKEGAVVKDERGNVWSDITVNPETGEVSVVVPKDADIIGGETIFVPVVVEYNDPETGGIKTEEVTAQFIARPRYYANDTHEVKSPIPFETNIVYDENLDAGTVVKTDGEVGEKQTLYEWSFDSAEKDPANRVLVNTTETIIKEKKDAEIRIGVKPVEEKVVIPHTIEYIVDPTLKPGEEEMIEEGLDGEITVKTTRDPETGKISITKEETLAMQPMKVKVGAYEHKNDIPFDTTVITDDNLPAGTTETVTEGVVGKTETKVTPAKIADMDDMMTTIGKENFRAEDNTPNYNAIANYMVDKGFWDADKITKTIDETGKVTEAKYGDKTFEELLMFDEKNNPQGKAVVSGKVETKTITEKQDKVIKVGTKTTGTVVDEDKIPFGIKVEKDPLLKKGEWKYKKDANGQPLSGKVGTNKKTWTIVNSKIVGDPVVEETKPVDAVILVGDENFTGNVTHDVEEKIPFKVQVIEDPTMDKGKTEVVQTGVEGTKTTTYTQAIENGQAKGDMTSTVKSTTEAKDHIIKIGTKPLTGSANVETKNQKPFDVEIEYDNTKPAGTVEIVEGTGVPGEETKTTPVTSEDGTVTPGETTTKEDKAPINKKIIVGTQGYNGEFKHEYTNIIPFETEVEIDPTLAPNEVKEVQAGVNGETKTTVTQTITNGVAGDKQVSEPVKTKDPVNRKIKVGAKTEGKHSYTEELPFKYEVKVNPEREAGTYEIIKPGKVGSKTTEWTITNSVAGEGKVTAETPAENAVIEVGNKDFTGTVTHDVTEEIPFTVKVEEDPTMDKGKSEVKQQGVAGSKTTTYTQNIKNGAADGEMTSTVKSETAPVEHIIKVGTKPLTGSTTVTSKNEKPFEVEIVYDNTKPIGFVEEKGGVVGEETKTTPVTSEDGTVTAGETSTKVDKAPVKKTITVGTKDYTGEFTHEYTNTIPFETEVTVDPSLKPNEIVEDQEGINGVTKTTVTQSFTNGTLGEKKVSEPTEVTKVQNRKIRIGSMTEGTHTHTEDIPFDYEVKYDSTIEAGKYEIEVAGEKGTRTTKWTIKNSEVQGNPEVTETQPTNAIIKVGNKDFTGTVTHTDKKEIPFEVEIVENPNLLVGTNNVKQQGEVGEKEVTYSQAIRNGQAEGNVTSTEKETKAPKKHIIEVGTKPVEGNTHEVNENVNVEIEYVTDENLEKGKVETGDLVPGKVTSKLVNKIVDGKVVTEEVKEVTPAKQIIKVGAKDFTGTVSHEVKEEVPFTVRIVEDTTMKPGTSRVETQGKAGSKTTKYSQDVVNGQASGDMKSEVIATTDPTEHVIHVGTAPVENSKNLSEEVPAEVEYVYDETKDKGTVEKGDYTPGKVETKVVNKYDPKTGEITTTEEKVVTPAKQKIIVGTKDFTGEFKYEHKNVVPFETEIVFDDTMKAGTSEVVTKGENGETTTTVTQSFTNGTKGELTTNTVENKKPTKQVIKVGSMTEGTHSHTEKIPFNYTVEYDPNMEAGKYEVVTPGATGSRKTEWSIKNSQVVGEPTVTETPATNAVIKVGNKDFTGTFETVDKNPIPFEVEYKVDPTLEPGKEVVDQEGELGEESTTTTHTIKNGKVESSTPGETIQTKAPVKKIVRIGAKTDGTYTHKEEVPFDVKVEVDPTLNKGEYKVATPGKAGEKTTTVTIENSKVVGEPKVEETKPTTQVIKVGSKDFTGEVSHEVTEELAFEVEIIEDETLDAGTIVVDQEGAKGSKTTKYTQAVKNGQADGELKSEVTKETPAQKRVVRVGKKPGTCPIPESTETPINKDVPVEIEYVYDNTKDKGFVEKGEVTPGKVETKVVSKLVDGKIVATEETVVTPAKQKIIVGTKGYEGTFNHETTYEQAYKTQVIFDENLESGKVEEVQAGQNGKTKETVTQTIVNGVPQDKQTSTEVITKAQDRIIRVGTKGISTEKLQETIKELPVEKLVEIIKEVPQEKLVEIVNEIVKVVPQESIKELIKEVPVEVIKEVVKEVPVEKVVELVKEVPVEKIVEITKEVPVEIIKEIPVEVIKEVIKEVPAGTKVVEVIKEVPVEVIKEIVKKVPTVKIVEVIKEVPIEVIKEIVKEVPSDAKVIEVIKEVPVEVIKEVVKEIPAGTQVVEVIKEIVKEVPVETIKEVPGIQVRYNDQLKPGEVKVVDRGQKRVTITKNSQTTVVEEGRDMIVEVGCAKCENPGKPDQPDKPNPGDPDKPVDPDQPDKPNPGDPDQPVDPDQPDKPNPGDPDKPVDPDQPDKPNPGDPDKPEDPDQPDKPNPGDPDKPVNPDQPNKPNPGDPDKPVNPDQPDKPNPGDPDKPVDPDQPNKPKDPSESSDHSSTDHEVPTPGKDPKTPGTADSQTPTQSGTQDYSKIMEELDSTPPVEAQSVLPDTGEASSATQYGVAGLSLLAGLGLLGRRRRKEEE
ncbi:G5 domain-containing protein [Hutsoniella sourekii]